MVRREVKVQLGNKVFLQMVDKDSINTYIEVGKQSYCEHYLHLWENQDPSPYIKSSFTSKVMQAELNDSNMIHFLVKAGNQTAGIVKLILNEPLDEFSSQDSLLAQKIYLLKAFSGKGIGTKVLGLIEDYARNLDKKVVWLDTMKNGRPIDFYLKHGYVIQKESELQLDGAIPSERPMWVLTKAL